MKKTVASIIIPTYNRSALLKKAIDSCLNQTVPCEIIVCDHGSTDNTTTLMETYSSRENIQYIRREKDFGPHFAWLEAVLHCSHNWVHIQYDDDWIDPYFMERTLALTNETVAFVCTDAKIFFEEKNSYESSVFFSKLETGVHASKFAYKRLMRNVISPGACLLRKNEIINNLFIGNVPLAKTHYFGVGPDILFALSSCVNYPTFGYIKEELAVFRAHEGSITTNAQNSNKQKSITAAYNEARKYARILKTNNGNGILNFVFNAFFRKR
jgi:glycosyltransferase involved in cell wall biosynthesis